MFVGSYLSVKNKHDLGSITTWQVNKIVLGTGHIFAHYLFAIIDIWLSHKVEKEEKCS